MNEKRKYFYRFDTSSALGQQFRKFWNKCIKAEQAAHAYCAKLGASNFYDSPAAFAGGVVCVSFPEGTKIDTRIWRSVGKDGDGMEQWQPNVETRSDVLLLPNTSFRPSDTRSRHYAKKVLSWPMVSSLHTLKEWAVMAGISLTGDNEKDGEIVSKAMSQSRFVRYTELYVKDYDPSTPNRRRNLPSWARQAISNERSRRLLPVVSTEQFYTILQGELPVSDDGKPVILQESTPTFFEWGGRYYVGCLRPCKHEQLEEINAYTYTTKQRALQVATKMAENNDSVLN